MKKSAVIFDMDGVIFDTERVYLNIWKKVYKENGYEMTDDFYKTLIGRDRKSVSLSLIEKFGVDFPIDNIFKYCDQNLKEAIDSGKVPVKKGALEIFEYLKNNNYKMAIATSSHKAKLEMQLKIHNLEEVFDAIICSDDVSKSKPDPEIFIVAANKLNKIPEECIVIEDSPSGIKAAFNAGIESIHVEDLVAPNEEMKKCSKKQFKDLVQVMEYFKDSI